MDSKEVEALRVQFERLANKNSAWGLRRSRKGNYVSPAISRDWKWFQLGAIAETMRKENESPDARQAHETPHLGGS